PARRAHALRALGKRESPGIVDAIQWVAAADRDAEVAQAAIDALANLSTQEAIETLLALTSDPSRRDACVAALAQLGAERIPMISRGLSHSQAAVRRATVNALGRMKQPRASDSLSAALDDDDPSVRLTAVNVLAQLGSRNAERKVVSMARTDSDPSVRRAAQKALTK